MPCEHSNERPKLCVGIFAKNRAASPLTASTINVPPTPTSVAVIRTCTLGMLRRHVTFFLEVGGTLPVFETVLAPPYTRRGACQTKGASTMAMKGNIMRLMRCHPDACINAPEKNERAATVPKTAKSFSPWARPRSASVCAAATIAVAPMKPKFHPIPRRMREIKKCLRSDKL